MSTIIATTLSNGSVSVPTATVVNGSAKAWVNFNGTSTIAARDSFNVASLTDTGTGAYTINFSSAFANANYFASVTPSGDAVAASLSYESNTGANRSNALVGSFALQVTNNNGTPADRASVNSGFIGDLA
jgi:hypothetical protein